MRNEAQKEARRKYEASDKGKAAKKRANERYKLSGGRGATEARRSDKPVSEARKAAKKRWAEKNKHYFAAQRSLRRALLKNASDFDKFVFVEAAALASLRKVTTGIEWHVDHIIPVSKGGESVAENIQVVPATWNRRKSNKHTNTFFSVDV